MGIENIGNFFIDIKDDITAIINDTDKSKDIEGQRISSLAFRIFGLIGIAFAAIATLTLLATFFLTPITNTIFLIISVAILIISYDHIIIGCNKHNLIKDCNNITSGGFLSTCRSGYSLGKKIYKETTTGVPADYEGTIIYKPVYKLFNQNTNSQVRAR
jgi:hypothetical protein